MNRYFGGAKEPKANEHIIWEPHYEAQIPLQWDCIHIHWTQSKFICSITD